MSNIQRMCEYRNVKIPKREDPKVASNIFVAAFFPWFMCINLMLITWLPVFFGTVSAIEVNMMVS